MQATKVSTNHLVLATSNHSEVNRRERNYRQESIDSTHPREKALHWESLKESESRSPTLRIRLETTMNSQKCMPLVLDGGEIDETKR